MTYNYNARNQLLSAGGVTNTFDAAGNRAMMVTASATNKFVINPNAPLSQVLMRVKNGATNYYVYGIGLLYEVDGSENIKTYHYDYRGSTVAIANGSGVVTDRIEYSAYGMTVYRSGTTDTPFLFNGRYGVMTDENGLLHMRARFYNPYLCRFVNPDPIGFAGGLNFYAYADGNPISLIDPFGLQSWALPPQMSNPEFARGYWAGAAAAVPAGLGIAGAVTLGPVAGGATLSAGINISSQLLEQQLNPGAEFSGTSLAVDTGIGAALPYGLSKAVPAAASLLPNSAKGMIGEGLSYINGLLQGRGVAPAFHQELSVVGRAYPVYPDLTYVGKGIGGSPLYVEAKFGTSTLSQGQRAAAAQQGANWITERWTYPWIETQASRVGLVGGAANAALK